MCSDTVCQEGTKVCLWAFKGRSGGTWTDFGDGQQASCKEHGEGSCVWEQSQKILGKGEEGEIAGLSLSSFFPEGKLNRYSGIAGLLYLFQINSPMWTQSSEVKVG